MIINKIEKQRNSIILIIDDKEYHLTLSSYTELYLYPNKELTKDEFDFIINEDKNYQINKYLESIIYKKRYTVNEIKNKLYLKFKINNSDSFINKYLESNILNDEKYVIDYLESKYQFCYGKKYFISELAKKGIDKSILEKEEIQNLLNQNDIFIDDFIKKLDKQKKQIIGKKKKEEISSYLIRRGFDISLVKEHLANFDFIDDEKEKEKFILSKINKIKVKYKNKDKFYIKKVIIQKLLSLGIDYNDINKYIDN